MVHDRMPRSGKERRRQRAVGEEIARVHMGRFRGDGRDGDIYSWIDSPLRLDPNDHTVVDYDSSFLPLVEDSMEDVNVSDYLLRIFRHKQGGEGLVVADFGGPGRRLARDIGNLGEKTEKGALKIKKSFGITLRDVGDRSEDAERNHTVAEANLLDEEADEAFETWRAHEPVDVAFSRMGKGLETLPLDPYLLGGKVARAYRSLGEGGVLVIQAPQKLNPLLREWKKMLMGEHTGTLETSFTLGKDDARVPFQTSFLIRKLPGAPQELPMLSAREVQKIAKQMAKRRGKK